MSTITVNDNVRPVTDLLTQLLAGLGFDAEQLDGQAELAIDRFDQWTNPRGQVSVCATTITTGFETDIEFERVA